MIAMCLTRIRYLQNVSKRVKTCQIGLSPLSGPRAETPSRRRVPRCAVPDDPNMRYGKPLTRLTRPKKTREMAIIRASRDWRDPAAMAEVALWGGKRGGGRVRVSVCLFRAGTWLTVIRPILEAVDAARGIVCVLAGESYSFPS